jgi:hypothetical protein
VVTPGQVYAAVTVVLLLVGLAVAVPVLKQIVVDGIERRRKWNAGEMERYTENEESEREPPTVADDEPEEIREVACRHCGAENSPEFTHCRECAQPL